MSKNSKNEYNESVKSINEHCKEIEARIVYLSNPDNKTISKEEINSNTCSKNECEKPVKYFANFLGNEKLLCNNHGTIFMRKNDALPDSMWFCKELEKKS